MAPAPQWVEQALRESERRFREVLENVQLVAVTLDTAGNITFCNDFLLELTGWERAEVLGRNWHATFIPPDLRDRAWHLFQNDIAHNTIPAHHENDIQTRQGERRCISWNNTILRDPQSLLIGTASIGEDITARREADHALQASEARFRLMFTNNPIAMWVYDRESLRFLEVNEATCARYGYHHDEFLAMGITDIRPAEDVPRLHAFLASHPPSVRDAGEWRHRTKDGRMIDVQIGAHELTFAGRPAALVVAEDITERKQAQERFAKAFHASPDATIIVRLRDRQIVDVNASWLDTTGYTRDEIIGHTMNELDVWASQAERERMYSLVQEHGFIREVEFAYRRRTGEIRWRVMSVELIEIAGEPCLLAMGRDVTERRQAEQALRRSERAVR